MEYPVTPEPPQACAAVILGFRVSGQVGRVERAEIQQHCVELEGGGAETGRGLRAGGKGPRGYANIMMVISSLNSKSGGRHTSMKLIVTQPEERGSQIDLPIHTSGKGHRWTVTVTY